MSSTKYYVLKVWRGYSLDEFQVLEGTRLRDALLEYGISPYAKITRRVNCGGAGICATCGVHFPNEDAPKAIHWHDKLAEEYGYPRLSCQIIVNQDMEIR